MISGYKWASLSSLANLITFVAVYFMIVNNLNSEIRIRRLTTVILFLSLFLGVYGLLDYFNLLTSTYYAPNYWAGYLVMISPIVIALFLFLPWSWRSVLMIVLSALLVINLAFSYSWGIVGFGIGMVFLAFMKIRLSKKKLTVAVTALVLILFAICSYPFCNTWSSFYAEPDTQASRGDFN